MFVGVWASLSAREKETCSYFSFQKRKNHMMMGYGKPLGYVYTFYSHKITVIHLKFEYFVTVVLVTHELSKVTQKLSNNIRVFTYMLNIQHISEVRTETSGLFSG